MYRLYTRGTVTPKGFLCSFPAGPTASLVPGNHPSFCHHRLDFPRPRSFVEVESYNMAFSLSAFFGSAQSV